MSFGRLIANFAALGKEPETVEHWAAAVWDIEDETLLGWALDVLSTPTLDLENAPNLAAPPLRGGPFLSTDIPRLS